MSDTNLEHLFSRAKQEARALKLNEADFIDRPRVDGFAIDPRKDGYSDAEQIFQMRWLDEQKTVCQIWVSITDIDALIPRGGAIEKHARAKIKSEFWQESGREYTSSMVPEELSHGTLALLVGEIRPTVTVSYQVDLTNNSLDNPEVFLSSSENRLQLSHQSADRLLAKDASVGEFGKMQDYALIGKALIQRYRLPYNRGSQSRWRSESEDITRAFMTAASEMAGVFCEQEGLLTLKNSLVDVAGKLEDKEEAYLLRNHPDQAGLPFNVGFVSTQNYGARHADVYLRLTAPMREYLSFVNMRMIAAHLKGEEAPFSENQLHTEAVWINSKNWEEKTMNNLGRRYLKLKRSIQDSVVELGIQNPIANQTPPENFAQRISDLEIIATQLKERVKEQRAESTEPLEPEINRAEVKLHNMIKHLSTGTKIDVTEWMPETDMPEEQRMFLLQEILTFLEEEMAKRLEVKQMRGEASKLARRLKIKLSWKVLEEMDYAQQVAYVRDQLELLQRIHERLNK